MEMGSGSLTDSGGSSTNSSTESLNCLKFGQKIYFENTSSSSSIAPATIVTATTTTTTTTTTMGSPPPPPAKSCPGSSSSSGSGKKPKTVQSGQSPRCQVEGCKVDLSDAKTYYSRHKVCGMHSKAARVIVAGLEQRFCQQCSRFHLLPEFDQGKRSCRRRLAGHNERRRKPPPGSLLPSRLSHLSSSFIENNGRGGGFMMDFTAYPRLSRREAWPTGRSLEHVSENQNATTGWSLPHQWQNSSENPPPPNLFMHGSPDGTGFPSTGIPPGECFTGVVDSNCALSLLSNQPWDSTNRASALGVNDMMNTELSHSMSQPAMPHGPVMNPYSNASWGFKGNDSGCSSQEMPPHLGLGQFSEPINSHFSDGLQLSQQTRRQYMELEPSSTDDTSMLHIHRSL